MWFELDETKHIRLLNWIEKRKPSNIGIIIVGEDHEGQTCYLGQFDSICRFSHENEMEDPYTYIRIRNAKKKLKTVSALKNARLCIWKHPDTPLTPIDKYIKMEGNQFPGSTTN